MHRGSACGCRSVAGLLRIALDRGDGALAPPQADERGGVEHVARGRPILRQHVSALADALHPPRRRTCVENEVAQASASWHSGGCSQRQITPQAAPSFGQPRPISRLGRADRLHRPCSRHSGAPGVNTWLSKPAGAAAARPRRGALVASTPAASTARRVAGGGKSDGSSTSMSVAAISRGSVRPDASRRHDAFSWRQLWRLNSTRDTADLQF